MVKCRGEKEDEKYEEVGNDFPRYLGFPHFQCPYAWCKGNLPDLFFFSLQTPMTRLPAEVVERLDANT